MTVPIHLPSRKFEKKEDANEHFSAMLNRYNNGDSINEVDSQLLAEILEHHPKSTEKKGNGIKRFYKDVSPHPNYKATDCFHIEHDDGSVTDFSVIKCIKNVKKS